MVGEIVNREIANFHLLCWRATKVVVCARSPILLSLDLDFTTPKSILQKFLELLLREACIPMSQF